MLLLKLGDGSSTLITSFNQAEATHTQSPELTL
jgi:hypothetical protein